MTDNRFDGLTRRTAAAALAAFAIPRGTDARRRNHKRKRRGDRDAGGSATAPCQPFQGLCNAVVIGYCNSLPNNQNECMGQCQHCCSVPIDTCPAVSNLTCLLQCAPKG